jgi:hypothetical protein
MSRWHQVDEPVPVDFYGLSHLVVNRCLELRAVEDERVVFAGLPTGI